MTTPGSASSSSSNPNEPVLGHQQQEGLNSSSTATNNLWLEKLPHDAMSQVLNHCSDFRTILNLANASEDFQATIYNQGWKCHRCRDPLFVGSSPLETKKHTNPFICGVCQKKMCGESIDYDRRYCRPQKCDGCGKIECYDCQQAHMQEDSGDGYGTENYCEECQAEFEFGMGGC